VAVAEPEPIALVTNRRKAAQQSLEDFTRSIERKKDREMDQISMVGTGGTLAQQPVLNNKKDVGRNDPCPCGSGKKYKKCHGVNA
jgi:preprotein translocase subunit SecA